MPMWIDSPSGGHPFRPWGAVWVTKPDGLVGTELAQSSETPGADSAVTALIELALRYQDRLMGRPGRLEVVDAELGAAVVAALGDPGVAVDVVPELTEVKHVLRALAADPDDLRPRGDSVMLGGPDEAIAYVEHVGDVWHETPGAVEWLRRETTKHGRGARSARGGRTGGRPSRHRRQGPVNE